MEQVLFRLHAKLMSASGSIFGNKVRRTLECSVFLWAVICLSVLISTHLLYITRSPLPEWNCLMQSFDHLNIDGNKNSSIYSANFQSEIQRRYDLITIRISNSSYLPFKPDNDLLNSPKEYSRMFKFSFDRGLLMMTDDLKLQHNFTTYNININTNQECFGPPLYTHILHYYIGYDVVVMNWAISTFGGNGFLLSSTTNELFNLNYAGDFVSKKGVSMFDKGRNIQYHMDNTHSILSSVSTAAIRTVHEREKVFSSMIRFILSQEDTVKAVLKFVHCWLFNCEPETPQTESTVCLSNNSTEIANKDNETHQHTTTNNDNSDDWFTLANINQYVAFRVGVMLSAVFLFIVTTTLVSHILRETQERMLKFTYLLQYHVTHRLPIASLVFTHVLESLVFVPIMMGIYFFLFEFFSDQLLAFLVILLVWMGEIFSVLSCRCRISIQYFPKIFCVYFLLFHIYFFTFPFGFSYLALLTTGLFMLHAMMHFWNVFEVAAYDRHTVHSENPRSGLFGTIAGSGGGSPNRESRSQSAPTAATTTTSADENRNTRIAGSPRGSGSLIHGATTSTTSPRGNVANTVNTPAGSSSSVRNARGVQMPSPSPLFDAANHSDSNSPPVKAKYSPLLAGTRGSKLPPHEPLGTLHVNTNMKSANVSAPRVVNENSNTSSPYSPPTVPSIYETLATRRARLEKEQRLANQSGIVTSTSTPPPGSSNSSLKVPLSRPVTSASAVTSSAMPTTRPVLQRMPSDDDFMIGTGEPLLHSPVQNTLSYQENNSSIARRYRSNSEAIGGSKSLKERDSRFGKATLNDYGYERTEFTVFGNVEED